MRKKTVTVAGLYGMSALFAVDSLPDTGETVNGHELLFETGGKGFNQAVSALRMGAQVRFMTAVGDDIYGVQAEKDFQKMGLSDYACIRKDGFKTAFAAVCVDQKGDNTVIVHRGACDRVTAEDIRKMEDGIADSSVILLQLEMPLAAVTEALKIAKRHDVYTILNPAPAERLSKQVLETVDLLTPNWGEALQITGLNGLKTGQAGIVAKRLQKMGCRNVVITLGGDGAYMLDENGDEAMMAAHSVTCVDSAGAGDTFNGAVAAGISRGKSLQDSLRYAMAAAAISVGRRGVVAAIPTLAEVECML